MKHHGSACKRCGGTLRYDNNNDCVTCHLERGRQWRKDNPERQRELCKNARIRNAERIRKQKSAWNKNNRDKENARIRRWYKNNLEKARKYGRVNQQRRRARKNKVKTESYDFKAICDHYGNKCLKCGNTGKLSIDHIIPIFSGGDDIASNIQPLCGKCNSSKGTKTIDYRPDAGPLRWMQNKLFGG